MEFKRSNNRHQQAGRRIVVPQRDGVPQTPLTPKSHGLLFENDEPLINEEELENVSFKDILGAWFKQSIKHSPLEKKQDQLKKFKDEKLKPMKNDLKWALMADLDEPVKPKPRQPEAPKVSSPIRHAQSPGVRVAAPTSPNVASAEKTIDISINFGNLPKLSPAKLKSIKNSLFKFFYSLNKKQRIIAAGITAALLLLIVVPPMVPKAGLKVEKISDGQSPVSAVVTPDFETLLPEGKKTTDVGGFHRISPPKSAPAYAYTDTIAGVAINVTQQQIPAQFKPNIDENVATLAKNYTATDKISAGGHTIYVGTSAQGPQSAIFVKDNLLILIKSVQKIADNAWAEYVEKLR